MDGELCESNSESSATHLRDPVHSNQSFVSSFFAQSIRPDGRSFNQSRPVSLIKGVLSKHTAGSALVKFGTTQVLAGVTLQIGQPAATTSASGDVLLVVANHTTLQRWLQRTLIIPLEQLSLGTGAAWRLTVTCQILSDEGNLRDACLLAVVAALMDTKLPATQRNKDGAWDIDAGGKITPLTGIVPPIAVTFGVCEDAVCAVDPTPQEDPLLVGRLTMVMTNSEVSNVSFSGHVGLTQEHVAMAAKVALRRAKELEMLLVEEVVFAE
jgi:exosome complex RNA-binding protein Rrp42 (RNase PH superfamily)